MPSCGLDPGPETRDPNGGTQDPKPEDQLIGGTRYPKLWTLKVEPETRDAYFTWDLRQENQETERGIWDT